MSGSGKTTLASYAKCYGYKTLTMGDVVRNIVVSEGLEPTPLNLGLVAESIRRREGDAAVAEKCIKNLKKDAGSRHVVDGIRSLNEVDAFRKDYQDTLLVAVHSSPATRFSRIRSRGRSDDPGDWESFRKRDRRELGFGLGSAIAMADHMIVNEGPVSSLNLLFEKLMEGLQAS
jgi:dephospho-CoA kinase